METPHPSRGQVSPRGWKGKPVGAGSASVMSPARSDSRKSSDAENRQLDASASDAKVAQVYGVQALPVSLCTCLARPHAAAGASSVDCCAASKPENMPRPWFLPPQEHSHVPLGVPLRQRASHACSDGFDL